MKQKFSQSVLPRVLQVFLNFFKFFLPCGKYPLFYAFPHNILRFFPETTPLFPPFIYIKISALRTRARKWAMSQRVVDLQ
jgi:hypothetical protein